MNEGMKLGELLQLVMDQSAQKRDFTTSTQDNIRMVLDVAPENVVAINSEEADAVSDTLSIVLLKDGTDQLEKFGITENAHRQIASFLNIPWKYYLRLTHDHPDLLEPQVNALFEREPKARLIRVLDGKVRAFLSDRYRALDNEEVLEMTLPVIIKNPDLPTVILGSNVSENYMNLKVLFTGDDLEHEITRNTRTGEPRMMKPAFRLTNSETGNGALKFEAFFYDGYCLNGCVFGMESAFKFSRNHVGGKLIEGTDFEVFSDETRKLQDQTIISEVADGIRSISSPENVAKMAAMLRKAAQTDPTQHPVAAIDLAVKELDLRDSEKESILTTFLQDGDFSQFGLASAVTSAANKADFNRANELEDVGGKILSFSLSQWSQYVNAEKVAA